VTFTKPARVPVIRPERPTDAAAIHAVHAASFPTPAEARLVDVLRAAGRLRVSLVAEIDGAIVGHIAFSPVTATSGTSGAGLAPLAVAQAYRRRGIAAELVRTGLDACRTAGFGWAVVLGAPTYYGRFGFAAAAEFGLSDEYGGGPAFQAIALIPGALPVGAGLVRYAAEFATLAR
jgi:putative acetyltransferase